MRFENVYPGLRVEVAHGRDNPYFLQEGEVITTTQEFTGEEEIRIVFDDSGDVVGGFKARDLERA